ncbi:Sir2 family NAD-dependent protein deacetylase [Methylobacterium symbioticum]|uniref:NAD-dependent protein deacylase n=1 Tax=Methylobacterium symbioticum TaxID=2584084 RepID=A0A509EIB0_9HYPH|nr:Sir2 family NAD-dependent protein deacetylase [Methylobacterium symbioticum]VUD73911.1 NAD-dependent protein deacylase [Methylobacterium symbioticum]
MASQPRQIFILTGAGISAESGLGTFRDRGGLWARFDPLTLATPEAFAADPDTVLDFYNHRRRGVIAAAPNAAHAALARAEAGLAARGGRLFLCTQNVDDLHERAGSAAVVHMHGELLKARCTACAAVSERRAGIPRDDPCPHCGAAALRPGGGWFGAVPQHLDRIDAALAGSDLFVAVGTSGAVYPAAGYVRQARALGIPTCELNLEPSDNARIFDAARYGPASAIVPDYLSELGL